MTSTLETFEAARRAQKRTLTALAAAEMARAERDELVRTLRNEYTLSYGRIAVAVGMSRGRVAVICQPERTRR